VLCVHLLNNGSLLFCTLGHTIRISCCWLEVTLRRVATEVAWNCKCKYGGRRSVWRWTLTSSRASMTTAPSSSSLDSRDPYNKVRLHTLSKSRSWSSLSYVYHDFEKRVPLVRCDPHSSKSFQMPRRTNKISQDRLHCRKVKILHESCFIAAMNDK